MDSDDIWAENLEIRKRLLFLTSEELQRLHAAIREADENRRSTAAIEFGFVALQYLSAGLNGVVTDPSVLTGKDFLTSLYWTGTDLHLLDFTPEQRALLAQYSDFLAVRAKAAQETGAFTVTPPTIAQSLHAAAAFLKSAIEDFDECFPPQGYLFILPRGATEDEVRDLFRQALQDMAVKFGSLIAEMKREGAEKELAAAEKAVARNSAGGNPAARTEPPRMKARI